MARIDQSQAPVERLAGRVMTDVAGDHDVGTGLEGRGEEVAAGARHDRDSLHGGGCVSGDTHLYRLRCVEAWAMAVPWTGFPLKEILKQVEPKPEATHVRFETFYTPFTAQGQLAFWEPWPYVEALTLKEAMNELTFLASGIYGHPLPKQHGAPIL